MTSKSQPQPQSSDRDNTVASTSKRHFRGSILLLAGRFLALAVGLVTQLIIVRFLAKEDYGAFAFAVSVLPLAAVLARVGIEKSLVRFIPIYQEEAAFGKMAGAITMAVALTLLIGAGLVAVVYATRDTLLRELVSSDLTAAVLLILIVLAPLEGLDNLLEKLLAIFASPRALFFRRHLLAPGLKLTAVIIAMLSGNGVMALAYWYTVSRVAAVLVAGLILWRVLAKAKLLKHFRPCEIKLPFRELYGFSVPLLAEDACFASRKSFITFLLEVTHGTIAVASYRAVMPVARLNSVVRDTFGLLFTPTASRLYARGDTGALTDLYWTNAAWIALLTFPVFAASFIFAEPLTILLFGDRYAESGVILGILSLGCFLNAVFGFSALLLRVHGMVRTILINDITSAILAILLAVLLVPQLHALGGAIVASGILLVQNGLHQLALARSGRLGRITSAPRKALLSIVLATGLLAIVQLATTPPLVIGLGFIGMTSLVLLLVNIRVFDVANTFPELSRIRPLQGLVQAIETRRTSTSDC